MPPATSEPATRTAVLLAGLRDMAAWCDDRAERCHADHLLRDFAQGYRDRAALLRAAIAALTPQEAR